MNLTLTDALRDLPDDGLVTLFRLRPDLIVPVPADLSALAARAQSRISVTRAVDRLDRFHLEILDAVRLAEEPDGIAATDEVLALAAAPAEGASAAQVRAAIHHLRARALVFGPEDAMHVVPTVAEVLGPYPAGLGRPGADLAPSTAELVADPARLRRTVLSAPPAARAALERLATDGPVGTCADPDDHDSPVGWLVSRGLVVAISLTTVELPREVGLLLRRDTGPLGTLHPDPPPVATPPVDPDQADAAGTAQAMEAVRQTEALLEALASEPAPVLRTGGVGVRDLRRLARTTGLDEPVAALLLETAHAAGLVAEADADAGGDQGRAGGRHGSGAAPQTRPTGSYDAWRSAPLAERWCALAGAWLVMTRAPALVGQRNGGGRLIGALADQVEQTGAPAARRAALRALADLGPGAAPSTEELLGLLAWRTPRRADARRETTRHLRTEAAQLGVTGRGALTSYGAALLAEVTAPPEPDRDPLGVRNGADAGAVAGTAKAASVLERLLPEPVDQVLVQADLTVVVPGPPEPTLAAELELVTEPESAGGASVHRVTRDSVRRALDAGYAAEDLHALFARRARTAVPQALSYLIDDVARSHGGLRVGSAHAYLRSDDQALVTQVLADRRMAPLGLRRLAPTVLASSASTTRLLGALREAGYAPVPEDTSGAAVLVRPRGRRAPSRSAAGVVTDPFAAPRMSTPRLLGIVEDIRHGDAAARAARRVPAAVRHNGRGDGASQTHTEAMAVLQQAVRDRALVWVGYVDAHGATTSRLLRPVSIGAGYLRAEDERTDTLHTFALHRITAATRDA